MAGSAKVNLKELDLSTRAPSVPSDVVGAITIAAKKGPTEEATLVTSDKQLLDLFTPNGSVEVGDDIAFFSALNFLQQANKLWVIRALASDALYSCAVVKSSTSSHANFSCSAGLLDPSTFTFDSIPDILGVAEVTTVQWTDTGATHDVSGAAHALSLYDGANARFDFWLNVTDGANTQTDPALGGTSVQVDILTADTAAVIAGKKQAVIDAQGSFGATVITDTITITNATAGNATDASSSGASPTITVVTQGVTEVDDQDDALLIYSSNAGSWGNDIAFQITDNTVKEANSFLLTVFRISTGEQLEQFTCSREQKQDGFGNNIFVEDVLQSSNYVRAISNPAISSTVLPLDQTANLALAEGADGSAVTDSDKINSLTPLENPDEINMDIIMDGGNATATFGQALNTLVETTRKGDSVAILSTPISDEASSSYINELLAYRNTELNLNSSFSALYTPHPLILDTFNDRQIYVGPDGFAAGAIAFSATNFEIWYPAAGFKRGKVTALDLRRRFKEGEMDILYDAGVNPIRFTNGKGIVIWGQKTLSTRPSALDRLNVRFVMNSVKKVLKPVAEDFLFDLNDTSARSQLKAIFDAALANIQARRGLTDFNVVTDESNNPPSVVDENKLVVDVFVSPTRAIENIPLTVTVTSSGGVSFST